MNILSWNCRGARNDNFRMILKELINNYNTNILIILEPKVSSSDYIQFFKRIHYDNIITVEANGRSGGIWLVFKSSKFQINDVGRHYQFYMLEY